LTIGVPVNSGSCRSFAEEEDDDDDDDDDQDNEEGAEGNREFARLISHRAPSFRACF
jgi:hypothetical protein